MSVDQIDSRAEKISDLIEQIIQLDNLLLIHKEYEAHKNETNQYIEKRYEYVQELNNLLSPYHLRVVLDDAA